MTFSRHAFKYNVLFNNIGIIWFIIVLYKKIKKVEAMGFGDAKLLSAIGFLLGFQSIFITLFIAAILGLIFSVPNLITRKSSLKTAIPFGPFLILASIIYFFIFSSVKFI